VERREVGVDRAFMVSFMGLYRRSHMHMSSSSVLPLWFEFYSGVLIILLSSIGFEFSETGFGTH
jgi:hypothetical protein